MIRGLFLFLFSFSLVSAAVSDLPPISDNPGAPDMAVPTPPADDSGEGGGAGGNETAVNVTTSEEEEDEAIPEEMVSEQEDLPQDQTRISADFPRDPKDFNTHNQQQNSSSQDQSADIKLPLIVAGIVLLLLLIGLFIWKRRKDSLPDSI